MTAAPMLASGMDLIGVLFFVVVAILSALSKKAQQGPATEEGETPRPERRPIPKRGVPPSRPDPSPAPVPEPEPTLEGQMRRFLEEMRNSPDMPSSEKARPTPLPMPQPARPVFIPQRTEPATFSPPRKPSRAAVLPPMHVSEEEVEGPRTPRLADTSPNMRAELGRSLEALHSEMEVTHTELREVAPPSAVEGDIERTGTRFDPAVFRTPDSARQAVLLSEVLGFPRALKPW
ncbi:MAG: hypothetical protein ACOYMV_08320 [Verrucomicrobiia bacterium]